MTTDPNVLYGGDIEESLDYPSLGDFLFNSFKNGGSKVAMVSCSKQIFVKFSKQSLTLTQINGLTDQKWTYNQMLDQSVKVAKALHGAGLCKNDVVSILLENRLEYASLSYGTMFLSAVIAPMNHSYTESK